MRKDLCRFALIGLMVGGCLANAGAQSYLGKQRTVEFSRDNLMKIIGEDRQQSEISQYLFNTPVSQLLQEAQRKDISPEVMESTFYISGKKVRVDMETPKGKTSQLLRLDEGKLYTLMWDEKRYLEMSLEEMKQMQAKAKDALKNLPPETRAKLEARMGQIEAEQYAVQVKKTDRSQTINGFPCEEYLIESRTEKRQIWASRKYPTLRTAFETLSTELSNFDPSGKEKREKEIWEKIPRAWPVVMKTFDTNASGLKPALMIEEMVSVEEKSLSSDTFRVPEGFTKIDIQHMGQEHQQ